MNVAQANTPITRLFMTWEQTRNTRKTALSETHTTNATIERDMVIHPLLLRGRLLIIRIHPVRGCLEDVPSHTLTKIITHPQICDGGNHNLMDDATTDMPPHTIIKGG